MSILYADCYNLFMISLIDLKNVVEEHTELALKSDSVHREIEKELSFWKNREEVIVLTGVRRSGKTHIMYNLLKQWGGVYIDFEDERLALFDVNDFDKLSSLGEGPIFLDEVQKIEGWELFVRRIHRKRKIIVSGSNRQILEGKHSSSLTGRTITFHIKPLNYREFLFFKQLKSSRNSFLKYLDLGGFPAVVLTESKRLLSEYFSSILEKDVFSYGVKPTRAERLAYYLLTNLSKPFSYRSLRSILGVKHEETARHYVYLLRKAFLFSVIHKYSRSFKVRESYEKKIYAVDHAFSSLVPRYEDVGRVLENAVYNNLKGDVFFVKDNAELDFLVCDGLKPQVGLNVVYELNEMNLKRELRGLKLFKPSYLLHLYNTANYGDSIPVYEYLLTKNE